MSPKVSVILPVRNGADLLGGQLAAIARQECSFAWEVVVVDNGSTDNSGEVARKFVDRYPHFYLIREPVAGKAQALNTGIRYSRGQHLIFADADDEMGAGYLQAMSEGLEQFDVVGASLDTVSLNPPCARGPMVDNSRVPTYLGFRPGLPGGITGMRASVPVVVGTYDNRFSCAEDIDYSWRAYKEGCSFGRVPDAVMYVRRPPTRVAAFRKSRFYARGSVLLYQRYRSEGLHRSGLRTAARTLYVAVKHAVLGNDLKQYSLAWSLGQVVGRAEESLRQRVFFP